MSRTKQNPETDPEMGPGPRGEPAGHAGAASSMTADDILRRAFETSPDAVVVSSAARRILSANAAALDLFRYPASSIAGAAVRMLYGPEEDWRSVESALRANGQFRSPVTLRNASGGLFDAEVSASATFDAKGRISGVVETIRAIESETARQKTVLTPDTAAVRLARGLAHDFNNMLAIINGNLQLADQRATDKATKRYLREAELACDMAARLTRRVMSFAEDRHLSVGEIAVAAFLKDQRPLLSRAAGDAITLTMHVTGGVPTIVIDRSALENALLNLVINARDAMPAGGAITITASAVHIAPGLSARFDLDAGEYVRITVSDTGTGMTPRIRARAFDPFFTTKDPGSGTGLGLATVYGFARQSGGTATIDSAPGHGTTVTLVLPLAPPPSPKRN